MIDQYLLLIEQIELEDEYRDRLLFNEGVVGSLVEKVKGVIKWFIDKVLGAIKKIAGIFRKKSNNNSSSSSSLNIDKDAGKKAMASVVKTSQKVDAEVEKKKKELFGDGSGEYALYSIDDVNSVIDCVRKSYEIMTNDFSDTSINTWSERFKKLESNIEDEVKQSKQNNAKANIQSQTLGPSFGSRNKDVKASFATLTESLDRHKSNVLDKIDKLNKSLKSITTPTKKKYTAEEMDSYYDKIEVAMTGKKNSGFTKVIMGDATTVVLKLSSNKEYIKRSSTLNSYYSTAMATVKSLDTLIQGSMDYIDPKSSENITKFIKAYADYSKSIISTTTFFLSASTKLDSIGRGLHLRF